MAAVACTVAGIRGDQSSFRSRVDTVAIYATVSERGGQLVTNLSREDFTVLDNGKPVEITGFSNDEKPISAVVLLDVSGSMIARLRWMQDATASFVEALKPEDRISIGSFSEKVTIASGLTSDKLALVRSLKSIRPGDGSSVWRAIDAGMDSIRNETGRRVVVVLSDGINTEHEGVDDGDLKRRGTAEGFMVYAVGVNDKGLHPQLRDVAEETGGGHVELSVAADLKGALERVTEELRHQYLLGFTPSVLDGAIHTLSVHARNRALIVRTAKTYLAGGGTK